MLPEYDLKGKKGVRGKYANSLKKGYSVRVLKAKHPSNHNVRAKIRQQLQFLRDKGVLDFVGRGQYRMRLKAN
jgi:hypothetical protein